MKKYCDKCGFEHDKTYWTGKYIFILHKSGKKYCWRCHNNIMNKFRIRKGAKKA